MPVDGVELVGPGEGHTFLHKAQNDGLPRIFGQPKFHEQAVRVFLLWRAQLAHIGQVLAQEVVDGRAGEVVDFDAHEVGVLVVRPHI